MNQSQAPAVITKMGQIENILVKGDLTTLNEDQRVSYYKAVCESVGLNPLTKPFDYIQLNGKLVLYAKKDATEQLRQIHKVSIESIEGKNINDVYVVTAKAKDHSGRTDSSTGAVSIGNLKGDALANALMKAETKAKRRVTLSICGLGVLDETEIETIPSVPNPARITPDQPIDGDGFVDDFSYRIPFGQWKGRSIEQVYQMVGPHKLADYVIYLEETAKKKNVPLSPAIKEFIGHTESMIGTEENKTPEAG